MACAPELKPGLDRDAASSTVPLRGQRSFGGACDAASCFPFNREGMNAFTSTNVSHSKQRDARMGGAYNPAPPSAPSAMSRIEELAERVERLLLRHEEVQRTNALLREQLATITHERDNLRSRLNAARSRIDVLLDRLPRDADATAADATARTRDGPAEGELRSVG